MDVKKKKKSRNYERLTRFLKDLFSSIDSNHKLSDTSIELLEELLFCVTRKICNRAAELVKHKSANTIIYQDIESAILLTYPKTLGTDALTFVSEIVTTYNNSTEKYKDNTEKAGLILKVSRFRKQIKTYGYRVSDDVSIALTAALQFLCSRIITNSIAVKLSSDESETKKIKPIHITSAINSDIHANIVFSGCITQGISF